MNFLIIIPQGLIWIDGVFYFFFLFLVPFAVFLKITTSMNTIRFDAPKYFIIFFKSILGCCSVFSPLRLILCFQYIQSNRYVFKNMKKTCENEIVCGAFKYIHNYIVAAKKRNNGKKRKMEEETPRNVIGNFQLQEVHGSKSLSKWIFIWAMESKQQNYNHFSCFAINSRWIAILEAHLIEINNSFCILFSCRKNCFSAIFINPRWWIWINKRIFSLQ